MLPLCIGLHRNGAGNIVKVLALASLLFFLARMAFTTALWANWNTAAEARLAILDQVPRQSRLFNLALESCDKN